MTEPELHVPPDWQHSAERILTEDRRRILVVGATDRGKSSYCQFLLNALVRAGRSASFVDADIGQKDVGPPATVGLADLDSCSGLASRRHDALYFVGHVSPIAHFLPLVLGTRRMVEAARGEFVVIDTTGLVHAKGRVLKGFQLESLQPDVLVCLERGEELAPIRHAARHLNILRLRPSHLAAPKSPNARRRAREAAFQRHLHAARELSLGFRELIVQRSSLFNGEPADDPRFVYAEHLPDGLIGVADGAVPAEKSVHIVGRDSFDHLLCGMADRTGHCRGLGIITGIDFVQRRFTLYTPVPRSQVAILQFGDMYLDRDGHELHLGRRGQF